MTSAYDINRLNPSQTAGHPASPHQPFLAREWGWRIHPDFLIAFPITIPSLLFITFHLTGDFRERKIGPFGLVCQRGQGKAVDAAALLYPFFTRALPGANPQWGGDCLRKDVPDAP
jgi:hypothetical protein